MNKILVSISLIFAVCANIKAQGDGSVQARKDSLRRVIPTLEGEEKIAAYRQLGLIYFVEAKDEPTMDSLLAVYREMDVVAAKYDNALSQCLIRGNILAAYLNNNMLDKVIELAPEYLLFVEKKSEWDAYYSTIYRSYALAWLRKGDTDKSLQIADEMYEHARARSNDEGMAAAYYIMGLSYERTNRREDAELYFRRAVDLLKDKEKIPDILSTYYYRLFDALLMQERLEEAMQAVRDCEKVVEKQQEQSSQPLPPSYWGNVWQLYTRIYLATDELEKAETYIEKMEALGFGTLVFKKNILNKRATITMLRGDYEKALEYVNMAIEILPDYIDYEFGNTVWKKGIILSHLGRTDEAVKSFSEVVAKGDSIRSIEFNLQLDELRVKHEVDALTAEKELSRRRLVYSLAGCALLLVTLTIWIYYSRRLRRKNINLARQILEQNRLYDYARARREEIWQLQPHLTTHDNDEDGSAGETILFEQIEYYMDQQQPYTDPLLNCVMIAEVMNTNEKYVRDCIRNKSGVSVNDYITSYRLKHSNKLLMQPNQKYTIETIARNSGFGSRNSFYQNYRSAYGLTPSEFLKASSISVFTH